MTKKIEKAVLDIFGVELAVGDSVAINLPNKRKLDIGYIEAFTPKKVRVVLRCGRRTTTDANQLCKSSRPKYNDSVPKSIGQCHKIDTTLTRWGGSGDPLRPWPTATGTN